jgi:hypothetical protein
VFVFAQPIGNDMIYNFNAASDQIDLIGFSNVAIYQDIQAHTTDDANGNAVIDLGAGGTITLLGVNQASLVAGDFQIDQIPVTTNAGNTLIGDGATLPLDGTIDNTGTIALNSGGDVTSLRIGAGELTLQGGGNLTLSDNNQNYIAGSMPGTTLTNVDNTISGAGQVGDGQITLVNVASIMPPWRTPSLTIRAAMPSRTPASWKQTAARFSCAAPSPAAAAPSSTAARSSLGPMRTKM